VLLEVVSHGTCCEKKKSVTLPESYTRGEERTVESGEALRCEEKKSRNRGGMNGSSMDGDPTDKHIGR
jgi:hypothetical protein